MSGWLQRLAARALGQAPSVRPIVGWEADAGSPAIDVPGPARVLEPTPRRAPDVRAEPAVATPAARVHREPVRHRPAAEPAPPPLHTVDGPAAMRAAQSERERPPARRPRRSAPAAPLSLLRPVDREAPDEPIGEVPPLLAPRPVPHVLPAQAIAAPVQRPLDGTARSPREETTEVHVSIGRIELTAVQDAPRPRREPARTRKPQSLEEYLKRREAERR
jgi:hypothetical protein